MEYNLNQQDDGTMLVALSGVINEDAEVGLQTLKGKLAEAKKIEFNFAGVKSINSLGVRAWVTFLRGIEENRDIFYAECVPDVIMQINMIPSFQDKAVIRSFYTNYICESCDKTQSVLIQTSSLAAKTGPAPQKCETCGQNTETEELEEEYFAFLMR